MFATIVIVLPSLYAGGEVRVVHGSEEKILDFSGSSQVNTAVLAWYADVVHEVKPLTSGFRLALSYNLIHTGNVSVPLPPTGNTVVTYMRQVFAQWSMGAYDTSPGVICYKLAHRYSQSNLSKGISCLKGVDAYKVVQIKEAAMGFDIGMGFGQFELRVVKEDPEEDGFYGYTSRYSKRRKYCRYDDGEEDEDEENKEDENEDEDEDEDGEKEGGEDDTDEGDETEIERDSTVSQLVNLEGTSIAPNATIDVDGIQAALIPKNAFKGEDPDDEEHEGYQGNVCVLFPPSKPCFVYCYIFLRLPEAFNNVRVTASVYLYEEPNFLRSIRVQKDSSNPISQEKRKENIAGSGRRLICDHPAEES